MFMKSVWILLHLLELYGYVLIISIQLWIK